MLCVDATNKRSFDSLPEWLTEIEKYTDEDVKKILLVNKSDLEEKTEITPEDLE